MKTRVITAIAALIVFLPLLFLGGDYFKYTTFALGVMAMYEIVRMTFKETNIVILGLSSLAGAVLYLHNEILSLSQYSIVYIIIIDDKLPITDPSIDLLGLICGESLFLPNFIPPIYAKLSVNQIVSNKYPTWNRLKLLNIYSE